MSNGMGVRQGSASPRSERRRSGAEGAPPAGRSGLERRPGGAQRPVHGWKPPMRRAAWGLLGLAGGLSALLLARGAAWVGAAPRLSSAAGPEAAAPPPRAAPSARPLLSPRRRPACQALRHQWSNAWCDFVEPSQPRGTTKRGKKNHFHLLDRYIRRIDSLVPEDMEDLVRPLSYKPNQEKTSRTLKITLDDEAEGTANVTKSDVREFLEPLVPASVVLGWVGPEGEKEVYVQFETNEECQSGRQRDGGLLGGAPAKVRYSVDNKFRRVCEDLGIAARAQDGAMEPVRGTRYGKGDVDEMVDTGVPLMGRRSTVPERR